jgi:hypothetical protein
MYYNLEEIFEAGMDAQVHIYTRDNSQELVLDLEVHRGTTGWEYLTQKFKVTFNFEVGSPLVYAYLQVIRGKKFME